MQSKICGVKDSETLNFLINYKYPPELIGFICNYPKSKRFVDMNSLQKLLKVNNKKSQFVSVLVKPNEFITVNAGLVKLPASRKTQESKAPSVPSAIASRM